jgi:hypothetical protein
VIIGNEHDREHYLEKTTRHFIEKSRKKVLPSDVILKR